MSSLENGIRILQCFSTNQVELRVSDVAQSLSLPKSTVSRLMKSMGEAGLLERDPKRRSYGPGILAFQLGNLYQKQIKVLDLIDEALIRLVDEFHATGYTSVLKGNEIVIIRVRQGSYPVRLILETGYRGQAFATSVGRALLARLPDDEVRRLHPDPLRHPEAHLETDIETLIADLNRIRGEGVAETLDTNFTGFGAIAAAIESENERQAVAFSLSFPTSAVSKERIEKMNKRVFEVARDIGRRTNDPYWTAFDRDPEMLREAAGASTKNHAKRFGSVA